MDDILQFIWTAFRQYWGVWVTGTGTVGLLLFALSAFERKRGHPLSWKAYGGVLFCVFWFLGTFSAWHDSQKNLRGVIQQRARDTSDLGKCTADLQTETALKTSWQERFADQQKIINSLQSPQLQQQATLNSCVVSLGKMNPLISEKATVTAINTAINSRSAPARLIEPIKTYFFAVVMSANSRMAFSGKLRCSHPFNIVSPPQITKRESQSGMFGTGSFTTISDSEYFLTNADTGAVWDAGDPVFLTATSSTQVISPCTFEISR